VPHRISYGPNLRYALLKNLPLGPVQSFHNPIKGGFMRPSRLPVYLRHIRRHAVEDRDFGEITELHPHKPAPDGQVYVYGGLVQNHFGHMIGEHIHRLWAIKDIEQQTGKRACILFARAEGCSSTPDIFEHLMHVLGIVNWQFIDRPSIIPEIYIPELAKRIGSPAHPKLQSWLEDIASRNQLKGESTGKIALTRGHLPLRPLLGEPLLEAHLRTEGYRLFKPEQHSLKAQLKTLYNAEKIIIADGSAAHLFDLLPPIAAQVFFYGPAIRRTLGALDQTTVAPKATSCVHYLALYSYPLVVRANKKIINKSEIYLADLKALTQKMQRYGFISHAMNTPSAVEIRASLQHIMRVEKYDVTQRFVISQTLGREDLFTALMQFVRQPALLRKPISLKKRIQASIRLFATNISARLRLH